MKKNNYTKLEVLLKKILSMLVIILVKELEKYIITIRVKKVFTELLAKKKEKN